MKCAPYSRYVPKYMKQDKKSGLVVRQKMCSKQRFLPFCLPMALLCWTTTRLCASWAVALVVSVPSPRRDRSAGLGLLALVPLLPSTLEDTGGLVLPLASLDFVVEAPTAPGRIKATLYGDI